MDSWFMCFLLLQYKYSNSNRIPQFSLIFKSMKKITNKHKSTRKYPQKSTTRKTIQKQCILTSLTSQQILMQHTHCFISLRQHQRSLIQNLIHSNFSKMGRNRQSLKFRQIAVEVQEQQHLRKVYSINDTKAIFTNLIIKTSHDNYYNFVNTLSLSYFKTMKKYRLHQKLIGIGNKEKDQINQTASHSFSRPKMKNQVFPVEEKSIGKEDFSQKINQNSSQYQIQYIVKGIQKMIKNYTKQVESPSIKHSDIQNIQPKKQVVLPDISSIHTQRVHTSPQDIKGDNYGLKQYILDKGIKKSVQIADRLTKLQPRKPQIRFHTQYDTEYIIQPSKVNSKSKFKGILVSKKSLSKKKVLKKTNNSVSGRSKLRLKK